MELYVQDMLCCLYQEFIFRLYGGCGIGNIHFRSGRDLPLWYFEWVLIWYAQFPGIKTYWRFLLEYFSIGSYASGFICFLPALTFWLICDRWRWWIAPRMRMSNLFSFQHLASLIWNLCYIYNLVHIFVMLMYGYAFSQVYELYVLKVFDNIISCLQVTCNRIHCYCLDNIAMMKLMKKQISNFSKLLWRILQWMMSAR